MSRPIRVLTISEAQRKELENIVSRPTASQRQAQRSRIILLRANGVSQDEVARTVGFNRPVVVHWEKRFRAGGLEGLNESRRSGRPPVLSEEIKAQIISEVVRPPSGHTQWSTRKMARAKGVSNQTVHKLWRANDLKPHLQRTIKLSREQ